MKYKLGDLVELKIGRTPPRKERQWFNTTGEGYKWVSIKDMGNCGKYISDTSEYLIEEAQQKFNIPIVDKDTVLLSFKLTVGRLCVTTDRMLTNEAIAQLPIKDPQKVDKHFLYYYLKNYNFGQLGSTSSIATAVNSTYLREMDVELPPLMVQRKIAAVLSSIDEKIELNKLINDNLQQQALMLYSYRIANAFSYKNGTIGNYCTVKSGFAFKSEWWTDKGQRVVKIKTIDNDALNISDCSYVSPDKAGFADDFNVAGGDLLIAMTGATIGKFAIVPKVNEPLLVNQRVGKFFLGKNPVARLPFIFCTLKQLDVISEIINRGQGSAQPNISSSDIMSVPCYIPNEETIRSFNSTCQPLFETIIENQYQNQKLIDMCNALLPQLMSGELDVSLVEV